jgi:hypothetical protein
MISAMMTQGLLVEALELHPLSCLFFGVASADLARRLRSPIDEINERNNGGSY